MPIGVLKINDGAYNWSDRCMDGKFTHRDCADYYSEIVSMLFSTMQCSVIVQPYNMSCWIIVEDCGTKDKLYQTLATDKTC